MSVSASAVVGWDVGGAHLKACLLQDGRVLDVAEWPCALWQGMDRLDHALSQALARWPAAATARHAVTMTGEMTDLFAHRQDGVQRIAAFMVQQLGPQTTFFAGDEGWCAPRDVAERWAHIASANWLATAHHAAHVLGSGVLVDIGSTTTDLIAFKNGRVHTRSRSDAQRLASGELVYHGVVRTPLCAVARRIRWRSTTFNVMNEFFATSADVYRLTGELDPAHDLHPSADNGAKDEPGTHARLARMVGLDARDGSAAEWLAFAQAWRAEQLAELAGQLDRVLEAAGLPPSAPLVAAGCGAFLVPSLAQARGRAHLGYGAHVAPITRAGLARPAAGCEAAAHAGPAPITPSSAIAEWAQVCAPSVAVAALLHQENAACG